MSRAIKDDGIKVRGFFRLKIVEDRGKSGKLLKKPKVVNKNWKDWNSNTIVDGGFQQFLQFALIASAGSKTVNYAAIGTGTAPASGATTLPGELTDAATCRCLVSTGTSGSKTVSFTFTLASGIITAQRTISNVGLCNGSTTNAGTLFAGSTYTASTLALNQAVNGTYQISFS